MKWIGIFLAALVIGGSATAVSFALTADEIIKLKQAGISDSTIELLILRDAWSARTWREEGWIVHSTETRFPAPTSIGSYPADYPIVAYPQVIDARRRRLR